MCPRLQAKQLKQNVCGQKKNILKTLNWQDKSTLDEMNCQKFGLECGFVCSRDVDNDLVQMSKVVNFPEI